MTRTFRGWVGFPFHQGRFQGILENVNDVIVFFVSIPPRKVSRLVPDRTCRAQPWGVSIPPRKVSRVDGVLRGHADTMFPFHQGRFQGLGTGACRRGCRPVSIPPRKVSREARLSRSIRRRTPVSIPPRKVSRGRPRVQREYRSFRFPFHQGRFQGREDLTSFPVFRQFPFHQGRFQGRSATSAPMFIQYSTSQSEKSVQGEKAASPCKQAIMHLSQTCVDPPPFSRHRGATHSLQGHTSKI